MLVKKTHTVIPDPLDPPKRGKGFRKTLSLSLFLILIFSAGCSSNRPASYTFLGMGTTFQIQIYDKKFDKKVFTQCAEKVAEIESWGNIFDPNSKVSSINAQAQNKWVVISDDLFYVLEVCKQASIETKGAFDVTVKPLMDYYQIKKVPPGTEVQITPPGPELMKKIGYQNIVLEKTSKNKKILLRNGAQIDFGGVLKGYSLDELVQILRTNKIQKAIVNAGGNIFGLGNDPEGKPWIIGIRDPENQEKVIDKIGLQDTAIATSAGYERYIVVKGEKLSHIADPRTGHLVKAQGSVTVVTSSGIMSDIYSTAVYVDRGLANKLPYAKFYLY